MSQIARRPLTLHISALSEAEYSSFTDSLGELTSPTSGSNWEDITLGVREARGWIRGRYGVGVDGVTIDQILKNFSPELGPQDILTAGQFFAVLRLLCHAQSGAPVDNSLVFVQANPETGPPKAISPHHLISTKSAPPPPPRPFNISPATTLTPTLPPRAAPPVPNSNPFTSSLSTSGPQSQRPDNQPRPNTETDSHVSDLPVSSNPFRTRSHQWPTPKPTDPSVSSSSSSSSSPSNPRQYALAYPSPPLPPRKAPATAPLLPPPRHASLTTASVQKPRSSGSPDMPVTYPKFYSLANPALLPPPKPPKPPQATSPLIKQSLQAAKGAQSVKEIMDGLSKERRLEVIKKSGGGVSGGQAGRSSCGSHSGEGTPQRSVSPPHSLYDVAAARIGRAATPSSYSNSSDKYPVQDPDPNSAGPHLPHLTRAVPPKDLTPQFPFAHVITPNTPSSSLPSSFSSPSTSFPMASPDNSPAHNGFSTGSGLATTRRTKSLHHPPTTSSPASYLSHSPPLPPPRRRPESVQGTSGSPISNSTNNQPVHLRRSSTSAFPTSPHSSAKQASTSSTASESSVLDTLHRKIATLRPGPGFESARVKAEGRVWPSGYVKGLAKRRGGRDGEGGRLVRDSGDVDGDDEGDGGFGQDQEWEAGMDEEGARGGRGGLMEMDSLKTPVKQGEGWTALS